MACSDLRACCGVGPMHVGLGVGGGVPGHKALSFPSPPSTPLKPQDPNTAPQQLKNSKVRQYTAPLATLSKFVRGVTWWVVSGLACSDLRACCGVWCSHGVCVGCSVFGLHLVPYTGRSVSVWWCSTTSGGVIASATSARDRPLSSRKQIMCAT